MAYTIEEIIYANLIWGGTLAVCKARILRRGVLYLHIADMADNLKVSVISGGSHTGNKLATQEFLILSFGGTNFREAMHIGAEVYHNLKNIIKKKYGKDATSVGGWRQICSWEIKKP